MRKVVVGQEGIPLLSDVRIQLSQLVHDAIVTLPPHPKGAIWLASVFSTGQLSPQLGRPMSKAITASTPTR